MDDPNETRRWHTIYATFSADRRATVSCWRCGTEFYGRDSQARFRAHLCTPKPDART